MYFDKTVIVHKFQQIKMYSKADIECFVVFNCMQKALLSHQLSCRYIYPQEKDYIHVLQVYLVSCDSLISFKSAMWYYSQHIYRVSIAVFKLCHLTIIVTVDKMTIISIIKEYISERWIYLRLASICCLKLSSLQRLIFIQHVLYQQW